MLLDDEDYIKIEKEFKNLKWSVSKNGHGLYAQKRTSNGLIYLHRYILGNPNGIVDHINHNTLDNRKENLRITTNANNLRNSNIRVDNKSGIKGVRYRQDRKKYVASIKVNYKNIYLGSFNTLEEAAKERKKAEIKYWAVKGDGGFDISRV